METYSAFCVSDYKGGELHTQINMTKKEMGYFLMESSYYGEWLEGINDYKRFFGIISGEIEINTSMYTGGGDNVYELYVTDNNKLSYYDPTTDIEMIDILIKIYNEYNEE